MPPIGKGILNSVFFIYPNIEEAEQSGDFGGTGFFVMVDSKTNSDNCYLYGVSTWHVVDNARPNPILRINTKDGKYQLFETNISNWVRHSEGDDIAAICLDEDIADCIISPLKEHILLTSDFIDQHNVGVGDEAVMVGRFRAHAGKKKNLPAAMFGNISMMPEEPVFNPYIGINEESYLVEMRSISGFSGSPVFLWIPPLSPRKNNLKLSLSAHWRLIGICWGYINIEEKATDAYEGIYLLHLNSSMAAVAPSYKIAELINCDQFCEEREESDKKIIRN